MFGWLDAVLTTPGTVALDAARFGIPVAVIKHELDLEIYEPLPMVSEISDWQIFIDQAVKIRDKEGLKSRMTAFVERNVIEGNAAGQILDNFLKQCALAKIISREG